jgi:hypothetical protein
MSRSAGKLRRSVRIGARQSIPSSSIASCAGVSAADVLAASGYRQSRPSNVRLCNNCALLLSRPRPPRARDDDVCRISRRSRHSADTEPASTSYPAPDISTRRPSPTVTERLPYARLRDVFEGGSHHLPAAVHDGAETLDRQ